MRVDTIIFQGHDHFQGHLHTKSTLNSTSTLGLVDLRTQQKAKHFLSSRLE